MKFYIIPERGFSQFSVSVGVWNLVENYFLAANLIYLSIDMIYLLGNLGIKSIIGFVTNLPCAVRVCSTYSCERFEVCRFS